MMTGAVLLAASSGASSSRLAPCQKVLHSIETMKMLASRPRQSIYPIRTLQRRLEQGRFMPDQSDRVVRLSRIYQRAKEVFESADSARE